MSFTDYYIWTEHDGTRNRFMWEVVRVEGDGVEVPIRSGIADSEAEARAAIGLKPRKAPAKAKPCR